MGGSMDGKLNAICLEYEQCCENERAGRDRLQKLNGLATVLAGGLFIGYNQYDLKYLIVIAPMIIYFIGFRIIYYE